MLNYCLQMKPQDGKMFNASEKYAETMNSLHTAILIFTHFPCVVHICHSQAIIIEWKSGWRVANAPPLTLSTRNQFFNYNVADFGKNNSKTWTQLTSQRCKNDVGDFLFLEKSHT